MTATQRGQNEWPPRARSYSASAVGLLSRHMKYKCMRLLYCTALRFQSSDHPDQLAPEASLPTRRSRFSSVIAPTRATGPQPLDRNQAHTCPLRQEAIPDDPAHTVQTSPTSETR